MATLWVVVADATECSIKELFGCRDNRVDYTGRL
jgi:hypothetical protein